MNVIPYEEQFEIHLINELHRKEREQRDEEMASRIYRRIAILLTVLNFFILLGGFVLLAVKVLTA